MIYGGDGCSFGQHIVTLQKWETKQGMLDFLARCSAGSLVLGEEAEQEVEFFSATMHLNYRLHFSGRTRWIEGKMLREQRCGVGICSEARISQESCHLSPVCKLGVVCGEPTYDMASRWSDGTPRSPSQCKTRYRVTACLEPREKRHSRAS